MYKYTYIYKNKISVVYLYSKSVDRFVQLAIVKTF